ncbi:MAG: hypothetical protein BWK79_09435 [Beggiatoa sp. IS2]|nr:MAG: hypothetical protein BWK79_09435 [Beggiatoa sp. IS2]
MSQFLTLSRAARVVSVTRAALQKKIRSGELTTFEGQVAITELLRVYPETHLDDNLMLERVEAIKRNARPKREPEPSVLPSPEVLEVRLRAVSQEFIKANAQCHRSVHLLNALVDQLKDLEKEEDLNLRVSVRALYIWLVNEMQQQPLTTDEHTQLLAKDTFLRMLAAHIQLIPSGHEFFVEGTISILKAALQAGLALNHGCTNGICGSCKARIVSGEVRKIRPHDYVISAAETGMGYVLLCSNTAVTDLVIEAAEPLSAKDIPLQQIPARIKKLEYLTHDLLALHVQTPRMQTLRFIAGQYVTLTLANNLTADYFVASCPCDGRHLEFHVRQTVDHPFSQTIFGELKLPQAVIIDGPKGDFVLPENATDPVLFLAYHEGFAPIKSLIEHAIALDTIESLHLCWIAPEGEHYSYNLCRSWLDALDNFHYLQLEATLEPASLEHAFTQVLVAHPNLQNFHIYVVGPNSFVSVVTTLLQPHHLSEMRLHVASTDP